MLYIGSGIIENLRDVKKFIGGNYYKHIIIGTYGPEHRKVVNRQFLEGISDNISGWVFEDYNDVYTLRR